MTAYHIRLWVTYEQETAIIELFRHKGWVYSRTEPQYVCYGPYKKEENLESGNNFTRQVPSSNLSAKSDQTRTDLTNAEGICDFRDHGVSFLSWLQQEETETTIHDRTQENSMVSDAAVTDDQCKVHEPYTYQAIGNIEEKQHIETLDQNWQAENKTDKIISNRAQEHLGHRLTVRNDSPQISVRQSETEFSLKNTELCKENLATKGIPHDVKNNSASNSVGNNLEHDKSDYVLVNKLSGGQPKRFETHSVLGISSDCTGSDICKQSAADFGYHNDNTSSIPVQQQMLKQDLVNLSTAKVNENSSNLKKSDKNDTDENDIQHKKSACKVHPDHELNAGIIKLKNRLHNVALERKQKFETATDRSEQIDKLHVVEAEMTTNKIRSPKACKSTILDRRNTRSTSKCVNKAEENEVNYVSKERKTRSTKEVVENIKDTVRCNECKQNFKSQKAHVNHLEGGKCINVTKKQQKNVSEKVGIYCKDCDHTFKYRKNYVRHLDEGKCKHVCEYCGKVFLSGLTGNYKIHLKYHMKQTDHECVVCGKRYVEFRKLKEHFRKHTGETPYMCDECGLTFPGFGGLYSHRKTKHSGMREKFFCSQCPKSFKGYSGLQFHMKYYHQAEAGKPYSCSVCSKTFKTPDILKRHETVHRETKDYKCDQCPAAFRRIQGLTEHKKRHSKDFSHFCSHCGKGFYTRQSRLVHERVHTGEKPYQCGLCPYTCALNGNLKKHMKTHNKLGFTQE